ncbi:MAG TPA: dockerin type I domain-containing protein [Pirellulales bacterium]|nr:dockerin type I domain-containing protein [Pirellulales bacterium]
MNFQCGRWRPEPRAIWCAAALAIWIVVPDVARAQFTFLNQIAGGPTNSPGFIALPGAVSSVGPTGQILIDEGLFNDHGVLKEYAADGTYLTTYSNDIAQPWNVAFTPDGTAYASSNLAQEVAIYDTSGTLQPHRLPSAGALADATGIAATANGSVYVGNGTQIQLYSTTFNGTTFPLLGSFGSAGTGPGQFGASGVGGLALDPAGANLYATDVSGGRVEVFSAAGTYESSIGDASGPGKLSTFTYGVAVSGTGLVYVADQTAGLKVYSTSGTYQGTVATTINGQPFTPMSVSVAATGMVYATGGNSTNAVTLAARFFDPASWSSGTNTFTNANAGPTSVTVGAGQLMGTNLILNANKGLAVGQTTTVNNSGSLTLAGGTLSTGNLVVDGTSSNANFTMTGGSLTANSITVMGGGVADFAGQPLTVALGANVSVADASSQFKVDQGATVSATALSNSGKVVVGSNADFIVLNNSFNLGAVTLNGGELDVHGLFGNGPSASIQGAGTLSTTTGLSNNGQIQFTGQASVMGVVNNLSTGVIELSGQQSHTFFGGFNNDGTVTIDPGSSATFQGAFSGSHGTSGTGTATFAGGLSPGDAAALSFGGNVVLQNSNTTTMHLAGTGYDQIGVAGQLTFNGALQLVLQNFTPTIGESFHLFSWGSEAGSFSQLLLPGLPAGESWNASQLYTQGTIIVTLTGDVNGDGIVNSQDLAVISSNWLAAGTGHAGDANNDGIVNSQDLALVSANWLNSFTPAAGNAAAVPEPGTIALAILAGLMLFVRRRVV